MSISKDDAVKTACKIVAMAFNSIGDYESASDCFCPGKAEGLSGYSNQGFALDYVRTAVIEKLTADGYDIVEKG